MRIARSTKNIKGTSRRSYLSSASTLRTTNLCTLRIAKDMWRSGRPFVTSTRRWVYPTSSSFTPSSSHATYKKMMICWTTSIRSRRSQISSFVWRYPWEIKISSWHYSRVCKHHMSIWSPPCRRCQWRNLQWTTWRCVWCTRCRSARRISPRWGCCHDVATKQNEQLICVSRHKVVLPLR